MLYCLRILHDDNLLGKNITLRDINNKLSKIIIQLSSNQNQNNYEVPVGTYVKYFYTHYIYICICMFNYF